MFVVHDLHLGFSIPTDEYGSKEKVEATKPQESPLPAQSPVIRTGKQLLSLYSLMCLLIFSIFVTILHVITFLFYFNII